MRIFLIWTALASAQTPDLCRTDLVPRLVARLERSGWQAPTGSIYRNVLIVELPDGQVIMAKSALMTGATHEDMAKVIERRFGSSSFTIRFAGEEAFSPTTGQTWVKNTSRLNHPLHRAPNNQERIENYRRLTGLKQVEERPYSPDEPHLNHILNLNDSRLQKLGTKIEALNIKHDVIRAYLTGLTYHLDAIDGIPLDHPQLGKQTELFFAELSQNLQRAEMSILLDCLAIDGRDPLPLAQSVHRLTASQHPNLVELSRFRILLNQVRPPVGRDEVEKAVETTVLPRQS